MESSYTNIIKDTNNEVTRQALDTIFLLHEHLENQVRITSLNLTVQEQFHDIFERTTAFEQRIIEDGKIADLEYIALNPRQGELDNAIFTLNTLNDNASLCDSVEFTVKGCVDLHVYNIQDVIGTLNETEEN